MALTPSCSLASVHNCVIMVITVSSYNAVWLILVGWLGQRSNF
jgi:hypothetical protein